MSPSGLEKVHYADAEGTCTARELCIFFPVLLGIGNRLGPVGVQRLSSATHSLPYAHRETAEGIWYAMLFFSHPGLSVPPWTFVTWSYFAKARLDSLGR
jgi:hypothetical protein